MILKMVLKMDSCETCLYQNQPDYCELMNKKTYGFCGNFTRIDNVNLLPRIYKCPKCLQLFNGRDDPNKCPNCGTSIKKGDIDNA